MIPIFVNLLAFLAVFFMVFAANAIILDLTRDERKRLKNRMEEEYRERQKARARASSVGGDFSKVAADARSNVQHDNKSIVTALHNLIDQSGMAVSLPKLISSSGVCGMVMAVIVGALMRSWTLAIPAGIIAASLPFVYVQHRRRARINRLRDQLPDAFDLMSRVLRAGQTISQAMQAVADEFGRPISLEFLYCHEQMNLGLSTDAALHDLAKRTGLLEVKIFVMAIVVHRQTGGNLAELLDRLAQLVRERFRIQGMIRSLTAQGRLQGGILLSLPLLMFCLLMVIDPEYEMILLQYPAAIATGLGMMAMGAYWIHKIVNFDF